MGEARFDGRAEAHRFLGDEGGDAFGGSSLVGSSR
jgi:hypothetical protein